MRRTILFVAIAFAGGACTDGALYPTGPTSLDGPSAAVVRPIGCGLPGVCFPLSCTITGISKPTSPAVPIDGTDTFKIPVAGTYAFTVNITEASPYNEYKKYEWLSGTYPSGSVFRTQTTKSRSDIATRVVNNGAKANYWVRVTSVTGPYAGCWIGYTFSIDPSSALQVSIINPEPLAAMMDCRFTAQPVGGSPPYTLSWSINVEGGSGSFSPSSGSGVNFTTRLYSFDVGSSYYRVSLTVNDAGGRHHSSSKYLQASGYGGWNDSQRCTY